MPRTFRCAPMSTRTVKYVDAAHDWSVEESTAPLAIQYMACPFHEDPQSYHEGPFQSPDLLLIEILQQLGALTPPECPA